MRFRAVLLLAAILAPASAAYAEGERTLADLDAVRAACETAQESPRRELLMVELDSGWTLGEPTEEGFLAIETRRNFRMRGQRVELFPSRLEPIGLVATPERVAELRAAVARGARLRVGFFLGFDEPDRTACVLRSRHATSTVRMDVAFVELVDASGAVLAREDTDRFRAWSDDADRGALPGQGPRAQVGLATTPAGALPEVWRRGLNEANAGAVGTALSNCHREGVARGAEGQGQVIVRVRVDGRSGRVLESELAVSDVGDTEEAECMAGALRQLSLPPASGDFGTRTVDLEVPVRVAN